MYLSIDVIVFNIIIKFQSLFRQFNPLVPVHALVLVRVQVPIPALARVAVLLPIRVREPTVEVEPVVALLKVRVTAMDRVTVPGAALQLTRANLLHIV